MHPIQWVPKDTCSLLDVGCNVGELLSYCRAIYPHIEVAGIEINQAAIRVARERLPDADLRIAAAHELPFEDATFDCVTCIEVLEHVAPDVRKRSLQEMHRVLRTGGRLVLRTPHRGLFSWLDPNNARFWFPNVYRSVVGSGKRDQGYSGISGGVIWHHHFTKAELLSLANDGWQLEASRFGGLILMPLVDYFRWPFYRFGRTNNIVFRALSALASFDIGCDYGAASFDILLILRRL